MEENKLLKFIKRLLFILASFATIVLLLTIGGYIFALFHGYLNVSIRDVSLNTDFRASFNRHIDIRFSV